MYQLWSDKSSRYAMKCQEFKAIMTTADQMSCQNVHHAYRIERTTNAGTVRTCAIWYQGKCYSQSQWNALKLA